MMSVDNCELCGYYEYDDEEECYICSMSLDEDEMYNFVTGNVRSCPYFQHADEYRIVRKQI